MDSSNVSAIASDTQILTSMPDQLTTQKIPAAANIAGQILKKTNVSEDSQVRLVETKIRLLWLNIWDTNSVPPLPAEGTLSFLLTVCNTTTKYLHFILQWSYLSGLERTLVESLLGQFLELSVNLFLISCLDLHISEILIGASFDV